MLYLLRGTTREEYSDPSTLRNSGAHLGLILRSGHRLNSSFATSSPSFPINISLWNQSTSLTSLSLVLYCLLLQLNSVSFFQMYTIDHGTTLLGGLSSPEHG